MQQNHQALSLARRKFLASTACGIGGVALASLLNEDGVLARAPESSASGPSSSREQRPHFTPSATRCIFIFLEGAPSQLDLYDPKPNLVKFHGQPIPESLVKNVRFAFIDPKKTVLKGSPRSFVKSGECGMELSDLLPHLHSCVDDIALVRTMQTDEFNHHPGQLMMNCGIGRFGRPCIGSWLTYGLGSEATDLPAFVVLSAGGGTTGGVSNWSSGFLPSTYEGVPFRNQGNPVLNLHPPPGVSREAQRQSLLALRQLNGEKLEQLRDPEISSRIASYELAFRMQTAAPELLDLSTETRETVEMYGVDRPEPGNRRFRGYRRGAHASFSRNCLLARRMVERGVRFVNLYHSTWDHHHSIDKDIAYNCSIVDQPIAGLLTDLKQRGLLESTLVVCAGEFGRTPLQEGPDVSKSGEGSGRDHHAIAFSIWMAGGGIRGGQVVGRTDELGWAPVEDPVHVNDFHATLLHLFGLDHLRLTKRIGGLDFRLTDQGGVVVEKLLAT